MNFPAQTLVLRVQDTDATRLPVAVVEISPEVHAMITAMLASAMHTAHAEHIGAVKGWGADLQHLNGDMEHFERGAAR